MKLGFASIPAKMQVCPAEATVSIICTSLQRVTRFLGLFIVGYFFYRIIQTEFEEELRKSGTGDFFLLQSDLPSYCGLKK